MGRRFFAFYNMVNVLGWFVRKSRVGIPHPFVYAVAADLLPRDRVLNTQDYSEAIGKAMTLANQYAVTVERMNRSKGK